MPSSTARPRTSASSPRIVRSAMPRVSTVAAALSTRSSPPSGSTMRLREVRAFSSSWYSNMSGVTTAEWASPSARVNSSVSTFCSKRASAVSKRRCDPAARRPRVPITRTAVSYVSRSVCTIGSDESRPAMRSSTAAGSGNGPLRMMPEIEGNVPDEFASSRPSSTSVRSAGTITIAPSVSLGRMLLSDMPATTTSSTSRVMRSSSPRSNRPPRRSMMSRTAGATSSTSSGIDQTPTGASRVPSAAGASTTTACTAALISRRRAGSARLVITAKSSAR